MWSTLNHIRRPSRVAESDKDFVAKILFSTRRVARIRQKIRWSYSGFIIMSGIDAVSIYGNFVCAGGGGLTISEERAAKTAPSHFGHTPLYIGRTHK